MEEGVRKHSNDGHAGFLFGSLPCSTSGEGQRNIKELDEPTNKILVFANKLIVCVWECEEEMMKNNSGWQIRYFRAMIYDK